MYPKAIPNAPYGIKYKIVSGSFSDVTTCTNAKIKPVTIAYSFLFFVEFLKLNLLVLPL